LRPALDLALDVARAGKVVKPSLPAPKPVERVLGFAKLSSAAWEDVRRGVASDDGFRARVAMVADEDDVGRAGWLWLHRPDGWEAELDDLVRSASEERTSGVAAAERRARREAEREARRRQRSLEEERDALRAELAASDRARRQAQAALAELEAELARVRAESLGAKRRASDAERRLAAKGAEAKQLAEEVARLRSAAGASTPPRDDPPDDVGQRTAPPDAAAAGAPTIADPDLQADGDPAPVAHTAAPVDRGAVAAQVGAAARAAEDLAGALGALAALLDARPPQDEPTGGRREPAGPGVDGRRLSRQPRGQSAARRRPLRLPGGIEEGSVEAAAWLVRQPATVLVDGYNVSRSAWDHLPIAEQRERLLDALEALEARTAADLHVVFDGAAPETTAAARRRGVRRVRVTFSPEGVEADDVVLDLVASVPAERPVVVATSDGRVRAGAAGRGANVVSAQQLLAILRR
jgi:predicted RNA-binding protein with PIN domain